MAFPGILFDLDGTLLDTLEDLASATNRSLARRGFPTHERGSYRGMVGWGIRHLVEAALPPEARGLETVEEVAREVNAYLRDHPVVATRPYPGIEQLLAELERRKVRLAILSNKPDELTRSVVSELLGGVHFEAIQGARDDLPRKPDPTAALLLAKRMGLSPAEMLYLGDSDVDMQTATGAGMYPVGAAWGFRTREELSRHGARVVIERPEALLGLLSL